MVATIFTPLGGVISLGQPDGSDWLPIAYDDEPLLSLTLRLPLSLLALPLTTVLPLLSTHLPDPVSVPTLPVHVSPLLSVMAPVAPLLSTLPDATVSPLLSTHLPVVVSPKLAEQVLPLLSWTVTLLAVDVDAAVRGRLDPLLQALLGDVPAACAAEHHESQAACRDR